MTSFSRTRPVGMLAHPVAIMAGYWLLLYFGYAIAPVTQTPSPSIDGFLFNFFFVLVYAAACWMGIEHFSRPSASPNEGFAVDKEPANAHLVGILALVGCTGAILGIIDKIGGAQLELLIDAASLRNERAQLLLTAEPNPGGVVSAVAFLIYPAGYAAVYTAMLSFERLPARIGNLALLFVPLAFIQSVAAGGRSGILVLLILIGVVAHVRRFRGQSAIPRAYVVSLMGWLLIVAFIAYSSAVWFVRSELSGLTIDAFLDHAELSWGVTPTWLLEAVAAEVGGPALIQSVMSTTFYFTQSLSVTEKLMSMSSVPTLLGGYHIDIVAAAMRADPVSREFLSSGYANLLDASVYGFFTGAWSALLIDFGWPGAVAFTVVWGLLAGRAYQALKREGTDAQAVFYGFWIYATFISFVSPPLGFSNSATTFVWFLVCVLFLQSNKPPKRVPVPR